MQLEPLSTPAAEPYERSAFATVLFDLVEQRLGTELARALSWHSWRIGLATALHASGASDGMIMLICRWADPASLRTYRRIGTAENAYWCDAAQHGSVLVAPRTARAPTVDVDGQQFTELCNFANEGDASTAPRGPRHQATPLPARRAVALLPQGRE